MSRTSRQANLAGDLRRYRKRCGVSLRELAATTEMSYVAIWRREQASRHPEHVPMSKSELYELVAAIERIVERRQASMDPAEVLAG